jgi:hypothetical protein
MQKRSIMMLIASSILIAGILVAGCTDSSSSVDTSSTLSPIPSLSKSDGTTPAAADAGDKHQFNESVSQAGTRPEGLEMNGTRPSGTPRGDMQMNGTRPSGDRPEGMEMNGTRPSGTPPDGMQMGGSPPSGSPPSGS